LKNKILNSVLSYKKINPTYRFVINGAIIFLIWTIFYKLIRNFYLFDFFYEEVTYHLTNIQLYLTKIILNLVGFNIEIYGKMISIVDGASVHLDRGCLGRNPLGLFVGFLLAFPGTIKHKLWFIPAGVLFISLLNVFRIIALILTNEYYPQYMDLNHHFIFKVIVYFFIFVMWAFWIKNLKKAKKNLFEIKQNS